jgi:hypothetical protein
MVVAFSFAPSDFRDLKWSAKRVDEQEIRDGNTTVTITRTWYCSSEPSKVSLKARTPQNPGQRISLRLVRIGEIWSMKEVFGITGGTTAFMQSSLRRKLFSSPKLCDRCSIPLTDGRKLTVAIRRLAAPVRTSVDRNTRYERYQIVMHTFMAAG